MTPEHKQNYLDHRGAICPYCGSDNIESRGIHSGQYEIGESEDIIQCLSCEKKWKDTYKLINVEEYDD